MQACESFGYSAHRYQETRSKRWRVAELSRNYPDKWAAHTRSEVASERERQPLEVHVDSERCIVELLTKAGIKKEQLQTLSHELLGTLG